MRATAIYKQVDRYIYRERESVWVGGLCVYVGGGFKLKEPVNYQLWKQKKLHKTASISLKWQSF